MSRLLTLATGCLALVLIATDLLLSQAPVRQSRYSQPLQWIYYDHPVADSVFVGLVDPLIWGLLILLASLWALFMYADDTEVDALVGRKPENHQS